MFRAIGKEPFMEQFDDKLEVQKITYLAQEYGIGLGYTFAWNRRGPYCKQVSEHAHMILGSHAYADAQFESENREKLQKFGAMMTPYLNDTDWLEIAASLAYLRKDSYEWQSSRVQPDSWRCSLLYADLQAAWLDLFQV